MKDLESVTDFSSSMRLAKLQLAAWQNVDHDVRARTHPPHLYIYWKMEVVATLNEVAFKGEKQ